MSKGALVKLHPINLLLLGTPCVCLFMVILWLVQNKRREADIVDFGWTISLGFLALLYASLGSGDLLTRILIGSFASIWAFRLGAHIWKRVGEPGEDGRYATLRQSWGKSAQFNFFIFFQAQAFLAILLSVSFLIPSSYSTASSTTVALIALSWFLLTIGGETLADKQLHSWRKNPHNVGRTCRAGLWNYSRHPNYFFEWLYWFSYLILSHNSDLWQLTLIAPAIILLLILKVTGIPPTEQRALKTRGDDYREYQKTTSAFLPWFKSKQS